MSLAQSFGRTRYSFFLVCAECSSFRIIDLFCVTKAASWAHWYVRTSNDAVFHDRKYTREQNGIDVPLLFLLVFFVVPAENKFEKCQSLSAIVFIFLFIRFAAFLENIYRFGSFVVFPIMMLWDYFFWLFDCGNSNRTVKCSALCLKFVACFFIFK